MNLKARYFEVDNLEESLLQKSEIHAHQITNMFKKNELNKLEKDKKLLIRKCNNVLKLQTMKIKYFGKKEFKCLIKVNRDRYDYEALVYVVKHFKNKGYIARIGYGWSNNYILIKI